MAMLKKWIDRVPGFGWVALACLLVGAFWLHQHDARLRQQVQLKQERQQTSAAVAALEKQAQQAMKQANVENAQAVQELEARRRKLEQQNRQLAVQLTEMRKQAQIQADEVATLPISEIVTRVAAQLGLTPEDVAAAGHNVTPHPAAGAATLSPRRGHDQASYAHMAKNATSVPAAKSATTKPVAMALTDSGARKVETALVELDSCRAESGIESRQISNCQARAQADEAAIQRLNGSVASLNRALAAKDKILRRQAGEYQAELRAARGTFWGRLAHLTEHVAVGVVVGVVIGVAVK